MGEGEGKQGMGEMRLGRAAASSEAADFLLDFICQSWGGTRGKLEGATQGGACRLRLRLPVWPNIRECHVEPPARQKDRGPLDTCVDAVANTFGL